MIKEEYKYSELTSKIIGCAMTVHKTLGNGFQEVIYQKALQIEMRLAGFCSSEFVIPKPYHGICNPYQSNCSTSTWNIKETIK